jgi:Tctex-1 family protein
MAYQHGRVSTWTNNVIEQALKKLTQLNKPFKYIGMSFGVDVSKHATVGSCSYVSALLYYPFYGCGDKRRLSSSPSTCSQLLATARSALSYLCLSSFLFIDVPVTCVIMQKNGAGLHTASSCFWDNATDGTPHYLGARVSPMALLCLYHSFSDRPPSHVPVFYDRELLLQVGEPVDVLYHICFRPCHLGR